MKEYIERAAALDAVKRTSVDYAAAWAEIAHMPAADVVEVVHCRDCGHYKKGSCNLHSVWPDQYSTGYDCRPDDDDFCSYAERLRTGYGVGSGEKKPDSCTGCTFEHSDRDDYPCTTCCRNPALTDKYEVNSNG